MEINVHIDLVCNILDIQWNYGPCFNRVNIYRLRFLVPTLSEREACRSSKALGVHVELTCAAMKKGS